MSLQVADIPEVTVSVQPESQVGVMTIPHYPRGPPSESSTPFSVSEHSAELSVIAEGDESPERSYTNTVPSDTTASNQDESPQTVPRFPHETEEQPVTEESLKITQADHEPQEGPSADVQYSVPLPVDAYHRIPIDFPQEASENPIENHTEPLPSGTAINSPRIRERNAFTAPLPIVPVSNSIAIPHTICVPLNDSPPRTLAHKSDTAGFPSLPAPSPLRKSVHVTHDAQTSSALPTIVPAPVLLGKRTSWLMKAREAKAKEGTSLLPGTSLAAISTAFPQVSTAVKRKSEEMFGGLPPGSDSDKDHRKAKVAKFTGVGFVPLISQETEEIIQRDLPSVQGEPIASSPIAAATPVDHSESHAMDVDKQIIHLSSAEEEGFIDMFKRTVEGLGARAGKSMGKSLGGAAVVALAEARAAAEARVAERNKVNSDSGGSEVLRDGGLLDQKPLGTQVQPDDQNSFAPACLAEGTKRRLRLSDLVPDTIQPNHPEHSAETAEAIMIGDTRINSDDKSVSTTPPDSPPSKGSSGFVKFAGPVFNKPPLPPVFMPPAAKQSSIASEHSKELFTLPAAVSLGIPARLTVPSDGFPPLVKGTSKVSTQSSQSSLFSDPSTDKGNGAPTWVPSTQDPLYIIDSQSRDPRPATAVVMDDYDDDDDDSWPLEEKLAAAEPGWRPFDFSNVDKEDTWSSLPTESQGPTRSLTTEIHGDAVRISNDTDVEVGTRNGVVEREQASIEIMDAERSILDAEEPGGVAKAGIAILDSVDSEVCNFEPSATISVTRSSPPISASH